MSVANIDAVINENNKRLNNLRKSLTVLEKRMNRSNVHEKIKLVKEHQVTANTIRGLEKEVKRLNEARTWFGSSATDVKTKIQQLQRDRVSKQTLRDSKLREETNLKKQPAPKPPPRRKKNSKGKNRKPPRDNKTNDRHNARLQALKQEIIQLDKEISLIYKSMQGLVTVIDNGWIDASILGQYAIIYKDSHYSGQAWVITANIANVNQFIFKPSSIRVGAGSGVTIFKQGNYKGTSQVIYSDIPNLKPVSSSILSSAPASVQTEFHTSRLNDHPKSIRLWDAQNVPFTGGWALQTSTGEYLSIGPRQTLRVSRHVTMKEVFHLDQVGTSRGNVRQITLRSYDARTGSGTYSLSFGKSEIMSFYDETNIGERYFSIKCDNKWVTFDSKRKVFGLSSNRNQREIFVRAIKMCSKEDQVGTLLKGEIALYKKLNYWGRTWVFYMSHSNFKAVKGLNNQISSIRLGTGTGATVYKNVNYKESNKKLKVPFLLRNKELIDLIMSRAKEDIFENIPSLTDSQVGNNAISALKVWHIVQALPHSCNLSQDYRPNKKGKLEEFSAYRVSIKLTQEVDTITIGATDKTQIWVNDVAYSIDEDKSQTFIVPDVKTFMITVEATDIYTPALKIRTNIMRKNTHFLVFPDQAAHQHILSLGSNALANAKGSDNKPLVKNKKLNNVQIQNVQAAMQKALSTIKYDTVAVEGGEMSARQLSQDVFDGKAWQLDFGSTSSKEGGEFQFKVLSKTEHTKTMQRLQRQGGNLRQGIGDSIGGFFKDTTNKVKEVVVEPAIEFGDKAINIIVSTAKETVNFIVDTVKEIIEFVASIIEYIGMIIKKFIEFLMFLFEWDDILKTQGLLNDLIDQGLDSMSRITNKVKPSMRQLFKDFKSVTLPQFDNAIQSMSGTTPKLKSGNGSASKGLGEAIEKVDWVVSKVNGMSDELDKFLPELMSNIDKPRGVGAIKNDLEGLGEDVLRAVGSVIDDIISLVEDAGTNPKNILQIVPNLLQIVRNMIESVIGLIEETSNIVLDAVPLLVKVCKSIMNTSIDIPFFSELFTMITGGKKLNLLNLATLIMAIPLTIASKSILDRIPFSGSLPQLAQSKSSKTKDDIDLAAGICNIICSTLAGIADVIPPKLGDADYTGAQGALLSILEVTILFISLTVVILERISIQMDKGATAMDQILNGYDIFLWLLSCSAMGFAIATGGTPAMIRRLKSIGPVISTVTGSIRLILVSIKFGVDFDDDEVFDNIASIVDTIPAILGILRLPKIVNSTSYTSLGVLGTSDLANVVVQSANIATSS